MERELKVIEIGNHKFEVKSYATAKENAAIQRILFSEAKVEMVAGGEAKVHDFNASVQYTMSLEMIRQLVVTLDGSNENIVERCENLPNEIFEEAIAAIDKVISKKKKS